MPVSYKSRLTSLSIYMMTIRDDRRRHHQHTVDVVDKENRQTVRELHNPTWKSIIWEFFFFFLSFPVSLYQCFGIGIFIFFFFSLKINLALYRNNYILMFTLKTIYKRCWSLFPKSKNDGRRRSMDVQRYMIVYTTYSARSRIETWESSREKGETVKTLDKKIYRNRETNKLTL